MQKPVASPQEEQELMSVLWSKRIKDDPEAFVLYAFPWGEVGTPLQYCKGPRKWQRKVLREIRDFIRANDDLVVQAGLQEVMFKSMQKAICSGRGIGKSALVAWLIIWMLTTRIGSTVTVSANNETQLRSTTWGELTKWQAMVINSHWWEISATRMVPAQWLTTLVERDLKKGTRYWGAEGKLWSEENPDAYAGTHNMDGMMVIFDEASGIPDSIWSVAKGFFTENTPNRFWFAFSNGRRNTGYFYECFHSKRDFWSTDQIDSRTVEGTDQQIYLEIIEEHGEESDEARVEVYGDFPKTGEDQFISPFDVDAAFSRPAYKDPSAPIVIGVDPARGGLDSTVIAVRQGRDIVALKRFKGADTMEVAGHVIDAIQEYNPALVVIDEGGLGYGILDRLHEQKYRIVRGVNFGWKSKKPVMWGNKRAELWGEMKLWLKTASIPKDRQLKSDLVGPMKKPDSAGVIYLEGKKEMKARGLASPDAADAIACTFAFPVSHKELIDKRNKTNHNTLTTTSWMGA